MALAKKKKLFALNHFFCGLTPGLSKILCNRVPGRRLSIYPETP